MDEKDNVYYLREFMKKAEIIHSSMSDLSYTLPYIESFTHDWVSYRLLMEDPEEFVRVFNFLCKMAYLNTSNLAMLSDVIKGLSDRLKDIDDKLPILDKISFNEKTGAIEVDSDVKIKVKGHMQTEVEKHIIRKSGMNEISGREDKLVYAIFDNPHMDENNNLLDKKGNILYENIFKDDE